MIDYEHFNRKYYVNNFNHEYGLYILINLKLT